MLLVYGPRSRTYDFGPGHPLTPRRFGPGIDLLRAVGAEPGLAPEPATDDELAWCHDAALHRGRQAVLGASRSAAAAGRDRRGRRRPAVRGHARGLGGGRRRLAPGDGGDPARRRRARVPSRRRPPPRDAGARVGLLHLRRPGAGDRPGAAGRPARPVRRPRRPPRRRRPGDPLGRPGRADRLDPRDRAGTCSRAPASSDELGEGVAAGTAVNVPLEPGDRRGRLAGGASGRCCPELAAAFGPDVVVSQHGADSHAWDPLAHLRVTTTAMGAAARLVDAAGASVRRRPLAGDRRRRLRRLSRRAAGLGLVWLAGAHREVPRGDPAGVARALGRRGGALRPGAAARRRSTTRRTPACRSTRPGGGRGALAAIAAARPSARRPAAAARGARSGLVGPAGGRGAGRGTAPRRSRNGEATILPSIDPDVWARLTLARGVVAPADPADGHDLMAAGLADGLQVTVAVEGSTVVGAALSRVADGTARAELLALGVALERRRQGLASRLLAAHVSGPWSRVAECVAEMTVAERDRILGHGFVNIFNAQFYHKCLLS